MTMESRQDSRAGPAVAPPTDAEVLAQLDRIRCSAEFDAPERDRKFLTYVIEETIAGRGDRIKAYSIATEVFGRDSSFDPQTDPAVRIEAGRIRRALERYYLVAGRTDPIVISIPKGAYVPTFERRIDAWLPSPTETSESSAQKPAALRAGRGTWLAAVTVVCVCSGLTAGALLLHQEDKSIVRLQPTIPRLVVTPFEDLSGTSQSAMMARGLTDEVVGNIAKFKEITVTTREGSDASLQGGPAFALEGRVRFDGERLRLVARLIQRSDGSVVWANTYDERLGTGQTIDLQVTAAATVAGAVAQPYGAIFQASLTAFKRSVPDDWQAYACTLSYYGHRGDVGAQGHAGVQECLQQATQQVPTYATAWALLSMSYVDAFQDRLDRSTSTELEQATEAAARAVELDPQDVRALEARMLALFFRGDVDAALAVGARALAINPNDAELAGEYGFRLALSGQWDSGCKLLEQSVARNIGPVRYFEAALSVCSYFGGDYVTAERWSRMADLRSHPFSRVMLLATLGKLGKGAEAQEERKWIETNLPGLLEGVPQEVTLRLRRPQDRQQLLDGLRKAGVPVLETEFEQARTDSSIH
ncbi:hypothetical protein PWG15_16490 [Ensifer adhaerens]|uniref:hypothetical protein n=1 Tax=Ensifer adhaerens TaxID=106592 RepID=UPI0023A953E5|nr:hypothetical protein [Ensifer adhaerens]WDZ76188.1 hypothetical protein PWG15_16490 [Ensifer adhaerens]